MNELSFQTKLQFEIDAILARTPWATPDMVAEARCGDPGRLVSAFHNPDRPVVVDWLLESGFHSCARKALRQVWDHDYQYCLSRWGLMGTIHRLEKTRPYETVPLPALPPMMDVWRGCVPESASVTRRLSWTLDRRVAAFFCFYHARGRRIRPAHGMILHRRIRRSSILMHIEERSESEVLVKPSAGFQVEVVDWTTLDAIEAEWRSSLSIEQQSPN
jgi:hypothetical protein